MSVQTFAALKTRLNIRLRNTNNRIFPDTEITELLTDAFNNPYVYSIVRDNSTTTVAGQSSYPVPSSLTNVLDIQLDSNSDGYGDPVDSSSWEQIGDTIYFARSHKAMLATKPLIMIGQYQLTTTDVIPDLIQDYVLTLAEIEGIRLLIKGYAGFFLKNSVSMSELTQALATLNQHATDLRDSIVNQRPQTL